MPTKKVRRSLNLESYNSKKLRYCHRIEARISRRRLLSRNSEFTIGNTYIVPVTTVHGFERKDCSIQGNADGLANH